MNPPVVLAAFNGSFTSTGIGFFGYVPADQSGIILKAANILVGTGLVVSQADYWVLQFGLWSPSGFQNLYQISLQDGLQPSGTRRELTGGASVPRGWVLALRASQTGSPAPLEGLSVSLEYGTFGKR